MENQESRSKWDELARQLGADVPAVEEAQPPKKTAAESQPAKPAAKPIPTPPKRPPSDWGGLLNELGLTPPEPALPVETEAAPPQRRSEPAPPAAAAKGPRVAPPSRPAATPAKSSPAAGMTGQTATPPSEPVPPPVAAEEEPRQTAGISLWHRIFGSPEEQAKKIADVARAAEVVPPEVVVAERSGPQLVEPSEGGRVFYETEEEPVEAGEEVSREAEERSRKRRPRRRRRGRGRKGEDQGRPAAEAAEVAPDLAESAEEETDQLERLEEEDEEDLEQTVAAADDELPESPAAKSAAGRPKSSGHRSIPSWEDTIGILVDLNMQTRSQRKQSATPPRGRPRGGRRRKKS